jgi:gliding motility-associated-like protein
MVIFQFITYIKKLFINEILVLLFLTFTNSIFLNAQHYFTEFASSSIFGEIIVSNQSQCNISQIGFVPGIQHTGLTMTPENQLILLHHQIDWNLFLVDQSTGNLSSYFFIPPPIPGASWGGLVSIESGVFYTVLIQGSILYKIDVNTGVMTSLGPLPFPYHFSSDLALFNGEIYYPWSNTSDDILYGIIKVNPNDPINSEVVIDFQGSNFYFAGLSASNLCNTLIAADPYSDELIYINLIDGAVTSICPSEHALYLTSHIEFEVPSICDVYLDLDENDSSGATDADYDGEELDCRSEGVYVSDQDITLLYDAFIAEMTIEISGFIPDNPYEILFSTGPAQNIDISGEGSSMITLSNSGNAKSTDFIEALRRIKYNNTSLLPTGGVRTVQVQFTTESGAMSNVATAFIEVVELPLIPVDLGPDQEICEGETATFNTGIPGATYEWSSGQTTQSIIVNVEGEYLVTVSDGENCPNQDTAELVVLPVVHVSLDGDITACDNEPATLIITTDSPFPLDIEIIVTPGSPILLDDVTGTFSFTDLPVEETEYVINNVMPSQPACIEITDPFQGIDVYPSYQHLFDVSICEGDSILLGFYWETEAGVYQNTFNTIEGCDSVVTTTVTLTQAIMLSQQSVSCNIADTGIFIQFLANPNGCDTIVETTVTLSLPDTTLLSAMACNASDTGVFIQTLTNITGCDSLIITDVDYLVSPFTFVSALTCDSSLLGSSQQLFIGVNGCDSIVVTTTTLSPTDTTYAADTSCDPGSIGVFEQLFDNVEGCDSLVITTVTSGEPDTTLIGTTSCDSASLGVFEELLQGQDLCDSLVITTVSYSASDSTFFDFTTCDETQSGVFISFYINRFGCDSIVTETITWIQPVETNLSSTTCEGSEAGVFIDTLTGYLGCDSVVIRTIDLLPSDETFLTNTTCDPSQAGMFITTLFNQYGCDSTVTLTVALVESDTTQLTDYTCDPSQVVSQETLLIGLDGCDSLVIESTLLYPLSILTMEVTSDFNGYAISCSGASDGSAMANIEGVGPFSFDWSTGDTDQSISGLTAGTYFVTITDGNGCVFSEDITLAETPEFSIGFIVSQPDCFDAQAGSIEVDQQGGIEPIRYSIDGINFQASPLFDDLSGGTYEITAFDANDCEVKEIIWLNVPLHVNVELGDNMIIVPGDTVIIEAIVNVPYDSLASILWTGLANPDCPNCLTQPVVPIITTTYSVTVSTHDGCTDEDEMTLFIERNNDIFIPNIFTPNGDGINDEIVISGGRDVERIISFLIYDRWGNVVFEGNDFSPNDSSISWDGTFENERMNPGVFAYRIIIDLAGGQQTIVFGDITLIR